jgi:predicted Zn-dependent peptidase
MRFPSLLAAAVATPLAAMNPAVNLMSPSAMAGDDFQALESKVHFRTLKNGLRVLVVSRGDAPVVSFHTYVDVGSVDERPGITGIAHMFEHMAFKGSSRIGSKNWNAEKALLDVEEKAFLAWREASDGKRPDVEPLKVKFEEARKKALDLVEGDEYSTAIDREGGVGLNASTGTDATQYFYSLPANKLELWAWLESERFTDPVLREFYKERDVVQEERRLRTDSNPIGKMIEEGLMAAFEGHPYGRPVIGYQKDLEHFSRTEAEAFYKQTYGPTKMVIAIVGKVDVDKTFDIVERYFERIPANKPAAAPAEPGARVPGEKRIEVPLQAQPIYVALYRRPNLRHADNAVYSVLADLLGGGDHSRLYKAVVKSGIGVACQTLPQFPGEKYSTGFVVFCLPAQGKTIADVEKVIDAELAKMAAEGPAPEELDGVRLRAKTGFLEGIESNGGLARELAMNEAIGGGWKNTFEQLAKINAVTAERVKAVAAATFDVKNRTVATIATKPAKAPAKAPANQ